MMHGFYKMCYSFLSFQARSSGFEMKRNMSKPTMCMIRVLDSQSLLVVAGFNKPVYAHTYKWQSLMEIPTEFQSSLLMYE